MRDLVLVHGRAQEDKDSKELKEAWVSYWAEGLKKSGLKVPLKDDQIHFPYYGDTLDDLTEGKTPDEAAKVVVRGLLAPNEADALPADEQRFIEEVLFETIERDSGQIAVQEVRQEIPHGKVIERSVLNKPWMRAIMQVLDRRMPGASAASVALVTRDVYHYLTKAGVRMIIDDGFAQAMPKGKETVVVSHSLGTVVAYNALLRHDGKEHWSVPYFMTLGSPLGVTVIKKTLEDLGSLKYPEPPVGKWLNAMDTSDYVALYPLDKKHFRIDGNGTIRNKMDVRNNTSNRHGIAGYLKDAEVAKWIYQAVTTK